MASFTITSIEGRLSPRSYLPIITLEDSTSLASSSCDQFLALRSCWSYAYILNNFLADNPDAAVYSFQQLVGVILTLKKTYPNPKTLVAKLCAIKRYYDFLIFTGQRNDHPCNRFNLKATAKPLIASDLFSMAELEQLLQREERFPSLKARNTALFSMLIYQGLRSEDVAALKLRHLNLDEGMLYVPRSRKYNERKFVFGIHQLRIMEKYLYEYRANLKGIVSEALFISTRGLPFTHEGIKYLIETFKPLFPDRNLSAQNIRKSVIMHWLNKLNIPLEQVQLMAGHRWISSTEKYREASTEKDRELMERWFPLE